MCSFSKLEGRSNNLLKKIRLRQLGIRVLEDKAKLNFATLINDDLNVASLRTLTASHTFGLH